MELPNCYNLVFCPSIQFSHSFSTSRFSHYIITTPVHFHYSFFIPTKSQNWHSPLDSANFSYTIEFTEQRKSFKDKEEK